MSDTNSSPVVLLAFANDPRNHLRFLADEHHAIKSALEPAVRDGLCEIVELSNANVDLVRQTVQRLQGRIVAFHYGGHAGDFNLFLETPGGGNEATSGKSLAELLGRHQTLEIVFLNGCCTRQQTQALLDAGVNAVISTDTTINDFLARKLAVNFYEGLAAGIGLQTAFRDAMFGLEPTREDDQTRALGAARKSPAAAGEEIPWAIQFREGAEDVAEWNLPSAANKPLKGLPALPMADLPTSPFRGLERFRAEQAEVFFGRGHEIRDLFRKVTSPETSPIILLYGQSGAGKSSMLDAGLLPRLQAPRPDDHPAGKPHHVFYHPRDAEQGLLGTLKLAFLPECVDMSPLEAWRKKEEVLGRPLTVILDQMEELETRPSPSLSRDKEWHDFLKTIDDIFRARPDRPQGRLILSFREEFLATVTSDLNQKDGVGLPYNEVRLAQLDKKRIVEVIEGPVSTRRLQNKYKLKLDSGLAQQIANDLMKDRAGAIAPTLQILLARMWKEAKTTSSANPHFSNNLYVEMQREGLLLDEFLDRQLDELKTAFGQDLILDLLSSHTTPRGTAEARIRRELRERYSHQEQKRLENILSACTRAYLLTVPDLWPSEKDLQQKRDRSAPNGIETHADDEAKKEYERGFGGSNGQHDDAQTRLAHDTLAPLVRARYESSDEPGQRAHRVLVNRVVDWRKGHRAPLDEQDLAIVEAGREGMRAWSKDEADLVALSRQAQAKRVIVRRTRRITFTCLFIASVVFGIYAWRMAEIAKQEKTRTAELLGLQEREKQRQASLAKIYKRAQNREKEATARADLLTARGILLSLRDTGPISNDEWVALWNASNADDRSKELVLEIGLNQPEFHARLASRAMFVVNAVTGMNPLRREVAVETASVALSRWQTKKWDDRHQKIKYLNLNAIVRTVAALDVDDPTFLNQLNTALSSAIDIASSDYKEKYEVLALRVAATANSEDGSRFVSKDSPLAKGDDITEAEFNQLLFEIAIRKRREEAEKVDQLVVVHSLAALGYAATVDDPYVKKMAHERVTSNAEQADQKLPTLSEIDVAQLAELAFRLSEVGSQLNPDSSKALIERVGEESDFSDDKSNAEIAATLKQLTGIVSSDDAPALVPALLEVADRFHGADKNRVISFLSWATEGQSQFDEALRVVIWQAYVDTLALEHLSAEAIRELPSRLSLLNDTQLAELQVGMLHALEEESDYGVVAAIASVWAKSGVRPDAKQLDRIVAKLCLWLYHGNPTENESELSDTINALKELASEKSVDRELIAHAICRVSFWGNGSGGSFWESAGEDRTDLIALRKVVAGLPPKAMLRLLNSPWCVSEPRNIVLSELDKNTKYSFNGRMTMLLDLADKVVADLRQHQHDVTRADIWKPVEFPVLFKSDRDSYQPGKFQRVGDAYMFTTTGR